MTALTPEQIQERLIIHPSWRLEGVWLARDLQFADFEAASARLRGDPTLHWSTSPFATRLDDADGTRLTLTRNQLKTIDAHGNVDREPVPPESWNDVLRERFGIAETVTPDQLIKQDGRTAP